ncbi:MAG: hypothetical protein MUF15_18090 [Acidobacteria bacterium]|jgi:hypothetical protein|nr:hypothetical protein [Acidobacteriota bacterium]
MKNIYSFVILFFIFLLPGIYAAASGMETRTWWEIQLLINADGNYKYDTNDNTINGKYSFKIVSSASMEQDKSGDYILYQGSERIPVIDWQETSADKIGNNITTTDLSKTMMPGIHLNYVIKKNGKLFFDFDIFFNAPIVDNGHPFKGFLLPRSALNQSLDPKNKYNKNVCQGSNSVEVLEEVFLNQEEMVKTFTWQWQRKKTDFFNSHNVTVELKIIKNSTGK